MQYLTRPQIPTLTALSKRGKYEEAIAGVKQLLEEDPENLAAHLLGVLCALLEEDHALADAWSLQMLALGPEDIRSYYARALYLIEIGQGAIGNYHIARASRLDPDNPDVLALQAAYAWSVLDDERALYLAETALSFEPTHPQALDIQMQVLNEQRKPRRKSNNEQQEAPSQKTTTTAQLHEAWHLLHEHNYKEAATIFQQIGATNEYYEEARTGLLEAIRRGWKPYQMYKQSMRWLGSWPMYVYWLLIPIFWLLMWGLQKASFQFWMIPSIAIWVILLLWISEPMGHFLLLWHPVARKVLDPLVKRAGLYTGLPMVLALALVFLVPFKQVFLPLSLSLLALGVAAGLCFHDGRQPDRYLRYIFYGLLSFVALYVVSLIAKPSLAAYLWLPVGVLFMAFQLIYSSRQQNQ